MASFAMPGESYVLLLGDVFYVLLVKRFLECIGVSGLTPLRMYIRVALGAPSRGYEVLAGDKIPVKAIRVRRSERFARAKSVIVGLVY
jgi:hypothetical protein